VPFILVTVLFFLWGVPDNLNDMLIRQLKRFLCSIDFRPAAWCSPRSIWAVSCLRFPPRYSCRRGYKAGIVTGLMLFGLGPFLFWPAAIVAKHSVSIANGLAFLETASNPFIAQLGSRPSEPAN
jgi:FHS family L-fucose permease-like MFS transporter